jgi:hypothetical protein
MRVDVRSRNIACPPFRACTALLIPSPRSTCEKEIATSHYKTRASAARAFETRCDRAYRPIKVNAGWPILRLAPVRLPGLIQTVVLPGSAGSLFGTQRSTELQGSLRSSMPSIPAFDMYGTERPIPNIRAPVGASVDTRLSYDLRALDQVL